MSSQAIIRPPIFSDFAQWQHLWGSYNCFYERNAFPLAITELTWSRFFDTTEPMHALVAEQNGKLLGFAHYLFHRSTSRVELTCYLQDLLVSATTRGQGIGRQLIHAVYEEAKLAGSTRVYWQTQEHNKIARKLYDNVAESSGFVVYSKQV